MVLRNSSNSETPGPLQMHRIEKSKTDKFFGGKDGQGDSFGSNRTDNITKVPSFGVSDKFFSSSSQSRLPLGQLTAPNIDQTRQNDYPTEKEIATCSSPKQIGSIIRELTDKGAPGETLAFARKRLRDLQMKKFHGIPPAPPKVEKEIRDPVACSDEVIGRNASPPRLFQDSDMNLSRISMNNSGLDSVDASRNSLNFSLSPSSALHGVRFIETQIDQRKSCLDDGSPLSPSMQSSRLATIKERDSYQDPLQAMKTFSPSRKVLSDDKRFRSKAQVMEWQRSEPGRQTLTKQALPVRSQATDPPVETIPRESDQSKQIERNKQVYLATFQNREDTDMALRRRVTELQKKIDIAREKSRLIVGAERHLRQKVEERLEKEVGLNRELSSALREMKLKLCEEVRARGVFIAKLSKIVGVASSVNFCKMGTSEKQNFESNLLQSIKRQATCEEKMKHSMLQIQKLKKENKGLSTQVSSLSRELSSGEALVDKLLKTTHATGRAEWETKEAEYLAAIRNYQQQVRKQSSVVSLELYKVSVDETKRVKESLKTAESKIACLERKLERQVKKSTNPSSSVERKCVQRGGKPICESNTKSGTFTLCQPDRSNALRVHSSNEYHRAQRQSSQRGDVGDLTGITILCQASPRSKANVEEKRETRGEDRRESKSKESFIYEERSRRGEFEVDMKAVANVDKRVLDPQPQPSCKENTCEDKPMTSRMQKVRKMGGRKGLQLRLNEMRSPLRSARKPIRSN